MLLLLGAICFLAIGFIWYQFFRGHSIPFSRTESGPPKQITIDFTIFEDPAFLELRSPRPPITRPDEVGKKNPFAPTL